eukprot:jgi/Galph1/522/GphlegSOOS_G5270.1
MWLEIFLLLFTICSILLLLFTSKVYYKRRCNIEQVNDFVNQRKKISIGFFHPFCYAGGGGERVLWMEINYLLRNYPCCEIVVYTASDITVENMTQKVYEQFGIVVPPRFELQLLESSFLLEAEEYPTCTLLGQAIGSMFVTLEAMMRFTPSVFIDTTGFAASMVIARLLFGCYIGCYVHYPTVSKDMLEVVQKRQVKYNNRSIIAKSIIITSVKLFYYWVLIFLYRLAGQCADVNSSWTKEHILYLWKPQVPNVVYPPCAVEEWLQLSLSGRKRHLLVSLSQFREEKNHSLQLYAIQRLVQRNWKTKCKDLLLVIMGSTRNQQDMDRVSGLKRLAEELEISQYIRWVVNASHEQVKRYLSEATVALHTMQNEHFGISIVEFMAAGIIPIAHRSGGVEKDIIDHEKNGYLATSADEYATFMEKVLFELSEEQITAMQVSKIAQLSSVTH